MKFLSDQIVLNIISYLKRLLLQKAGYRPGWLCSIKQVYAIILALTVHSIYCKGLNETIQHTDVHSGSELFVDVLLWRRSYANTFTRVTSQIP